MIFLVVSDHSKKISLVFANNYDSLVAIYHVGLKFWDKYKAFSSDRHDSIGLILQVKLITQSWHQAIDRPIGNANFFIFRPDFILNQQPIAKMIKIIQ